jgi:hypothetical protein
MAGIENFINYLSDNWVTILVMIGVTFSIGKLVAKYFVLDNTEKIETAKRLIKEAMLKLITEAELDFEEWNKAGSIKRSKVIADIYEKYPILSKAASQEEVIAFIDSEINNSLKTLREVLKENKKEGEK